MKAGFAVRLLVLLCPLLSIEIARAVDYGTYSSPEWLVYNSTGFLGNAQNVCLNTTVPTKPAPANCPVGAPAPNSPTVYQYPNSLWTATIPSAPGATWIWAGRASSGSAAPLSGTTAPASQQRFSMKTGFFLCAPPDATKPQSVEVAADDLAEVLINGHSIGTHTGFGVLSAPMSVSANFLNVAPMSNEIEIKVANGANPAGCGSNSYQCNPAGVILAAKFSDALTALPQCPSSTVPPLMLDAGQKEFGKCPTGQTGEISRLCNCAYNPFTRTSGASWGAWVNTCVTPQPRRACVNFDALAAGTVFGPPLHVPAMSPWRATELSCA